MEHCTWMGKATAAGLVLLLAACGGKDATTPGAAGPAQNQVGDYAVLTLSPQNAVLNSDFPATIQGQQNIEIRPRIDGYVEQIYVDEGSAVTKGQLLFRITAPQYEQNVRTAEAEVRIAQSNVNAAQMQVNKVRPLVEKNIISRYELESAAYTLQSNQAALAQARANLANARTNLGYTRIYSPANGVVGMLPYRVGSLVTSNTTQALTTVSNITNVYAYFAINEKQALNFLTRVPGKTMEDKLATLPPATLLLSNGTAFSEKGRVETVSGLINTQTGSVSVRATFPNPGGLIRSGSSAVVRLPIKADSALLVPQRATYEIQGKLFVYGVAANNTVRSLEIKVNPNAADQSYVVQGGLKAGDRIVVEGVANLREGVTIRPRPVRADSVYASLKE